MADDHAWFTCACHTEALRIDWFDDGDEIYVSLWREGHYSDDRLSWRHRLRYAWMALRGRPYTDQLVLHCSQAEQLARKLIALQPSSSNYMVTPTATSTTVAPASRPAYPGWPSDE